MIWSIRLLLALSSLICMGVSAFVPSHTRRDVVQQVSQNYYPSTSTPNLSCRTKLHASGSRDFAVAGRIPWKKLLLSKEQLARVVAIMKAESHHLDLIPIAIFAFYADWIGQFLYNRLVYKLRRKGMKYKKSVCKQVAMRISQASRIALVCYAFDIFEVVLEVARIKKSTKIDLSNRLAALMYITWTASVIRAYKTNAIKTFVTRTTKSKRASKDLLQVYDKLSDFFLFIILAMFWRDILQISGSGLSSIFAMGGAGTVVFTLAVQDLVRKALNGLALSASDAFTVGDFILLGDGTSGTVTSLGWLSTEILGSNELITKIPNSHLIDVRISNKSRMKFSSVQQTLRFNYSDIDKIPKLVEGIREEITKSCPTVITDGSRTFRVKWTDFGSDHIKVSVDCRLSNSPGGVAYYDARQGVLEAIARASKKDGVKFTISEYLVREQLVSEQSRREEDEVQQGSRGQDEHGKSTNATQADAASTS